MPAIAEAAIQIVPDFDRFGRELDTGLKRSLRSAGQGINRIMRAATQATVALGGAMGIISAQSLRMSADVERSIQMIEGLVGIFDPTQLQSFKDAIAEIAPATGQSAAELAKAMFFITSAGARGSTAIEILDSTARLGAAGLGDLSEIARGIVSAVNAYGESQLNAAQAADIFANTVRLGNLEATTLAPVLGHVIPIASQMGVSFDQVGGALAGMTRLGSSASESAVALRATLSGILKPTGRADEAFASVGLSAEMLRDALSSGKLDLMGVLELLKKAFEGNTAAMAEAFPNLRALRGVLALVGNNAETNRMIIDAMADSTGVASEAFDAQADTLQFKLNQMLSAYKTLLIEIGDALKPIVVPFLESVTAAFIAQGEKLPALIFRLNEYFKVFTGAQNATEAMMNLLNEFGIVTHEQNKLILKIQELRDTSVRVFDQVKISFGILTTAFMENFGDLLPSFAGFNFTITDVGNTIILALKLATDFIAKIVFPAIRRFVDNTIVFIKKLSPQFNLVKDAVTKNLQKVVDFTVTFVEQSKLLFDRYKGDTFALIDTLFRNVIKIFQGGYDAVLGFTTAFIALFTGDFETFKDGIIQLVKGLKNVLSGLFDSTMKVLGVIIKAGLLVLKNLFIFTFQAIFEQFEKIDMLLVRGFTALKDKSIEIFTIIKDTLINIFNNIRDEIAKTVTNMMVRLVASFTKMFDEAVAFKDRMIENFIKFKDMSIAKIQIFIQKVIAFFRNTFGADGTIHRFVHGFIDRVVDFFSRGFQKAFDITKSIFTRMRDFIGNILAGGFGPMITNMFNGIINSFERGINRIIDTLNNVINRANDLLPGPDIPTLPRVDFPGLQDGGTALTSGLALVGEKGPELIQTGVGAKISPITGTRSGIDRQLEQALSRMIDVRVELDSETIARKTAPIMVEQIRLRSGITIV